MHAAKVRKQAPRDPKMLCPAIRADGTRCQSYATKSGWCGWHDPAISEATKQGWRAKGKGPLNPVKSEDLPDPVWRSLEDAQRQIEHYAGMVMRDELRETKVNALKGLMDLWGKFEELRSLRDKLESLEALAGAKLQRNWG